VTRVERSLARKKATLQSKPAGQRTKSRVRKTKAIDSPRPATVLIVDDDPSLLRALNRLLSASGFDVKTFVSPAELLASEIPKGNACMVADIGLPEMTGIEMCDVLKASGRGLPTILITGRTDARIRSLAAESDAVAVLFKPFDEQPLLDAIGRAVALSTRESPKI
jgi:FixJ family two-component response regulator